MYLLPWTDNKKVQRIKKIKQLKYLTLDTNESTEVKNANKTKGDSIMGAPRPRDAVSSSSADAAGASGTLAESLYQDTKGKTQLCPRVPLWLWLI